MYFAVLPASAEPPRLGLLLRDLAADFPAVFLDGASLAFPGADGFPQPAGGFAIPVGGAEGEDGFSHPGGAAITPVVEAFVVVVVVVVVEDGFPHPGGALVTPTLDGAGAAFGLGTSWAVNVFAGVGAAAGLGGGA